MTPGAPAAMVLLADVLLVLHVAFVLFVLCGFLTVPVGAWLGWRWVRHRRFRLLHLAAVTFVALEALAGISCPLTLWEDSFRGRSTDTTFVQRLLHGVLFYDLPAWSFTLAYATAALTALLLWRAVPPARHQ